MRHSSSRLVRMGASDEAMAAIGRAIGDPSDPAAAVERLLERCGVPVTLQAVGVTIEDLDAVARLSQNNDGVRHNPRPVSEDDVRAILAAAY